MKETKLNSFVLDFHKTKETLIIYSFTNINRKLLRLIKKYAWAESKT